MQVALHFGAPYTDENRLQLCLGKNREALAEQGTIIPRPSSYRKQIKQVTNRFKDGTGDDALRMQFWDEVVGDQHAERVVFSTDTFLGVPRLAIGGDTFFPGQFNRLSAFLNMFDGAEVELFYAICNPANFVSSLLTGHKGEDVDTLLNHSDPMTLRWSEFFERLQENFPNVPVTVWCNEDSPLIWDEIVREVSGVDPLFNLTGTSDFLKELMSTEGFERFTDFIKQRPGMSAIQKRRVVAAFLEKFVKDEAIETEVTYPGWTDAHVDQVTELYDEDVYLIQSMPNVRLLTP